MRTGAPTFILTRPWRPLAHSATTGAGPRIAPLPATRTEIAAGEICQINAYIGCSPLLRRLVA